MSQNLPESAKDTLETPAGTKTIYRLDALAGEGDVERLPYAIKVMLEAALRRIDGQTVTADDARALARYDAKSVEPREIPYSPARVVLQDFTGVPAVVDLAAMREGMQALGGDPARVNPQVPCDLVIDHSVQVDAFGSANALSINSKHEFERNRERYEFLKWGQQALDNFTVVPPATGIVHQVNLEYLARGVMEDPDGTVYPDSLVGTDSHTTMINGLGVLGWGVGGIEAEAVMLGQPIYMLMPEVIGFRLTGELPEGATATDLVLTVTQKLRAYGVVGKLVEFFGPGLAGMPVANRATIANMAPEYGATCGFFPIDQQTLNYLWLTGRERSQIDLVERYAKAQGLWRDDDRQVTYSDELSLDLGEVEPSLAGPKRPQDRVSLWDMKPAWEKELKETFDVEETAVPAEAMADEGGAAAESAPTAVAEGQRRGVPVTMEGETFELTHGDVVIAAITSCTNTSNPEVMLGAGLVAKKAVERGLARQPWVKTSLAPGSQVVTEYLEKSGLEQPLEQLGFYLVGYGCTTCIGNSGPLPEPISEAINQNELVAASVLSGNRNFEGRVHPEVRANYLASPPLVVIYALAGTVDIDLASEPIGHDPTGDPVYMKDIWPSQREVREQVESCVTREQFLDKYANVYEGSDQWKAIELSGGVMYDWDPESTYIQRPPFFEDIRPEPAPIAPVTGARCLVKVGDSVTTDHISPAGQIKESQPAGQYLLERGVKKPLFNSYGSRRGNHEVMMRGTFANPRVRNHLAPGTEGGWTTDLLDGEVKSIYDAAMHYSSEGVPLVVLAGEDYGMGSSRDWAAKGTRLLGVRTVIAASYERIHRSNLVGMGVLPLQFAEGESAETLGLDGTETFDIPVDDELSPRQTIRVTARKPDGTEIAFDTRARVDTDVEVAYYRHGGILHYVLREMIRPSN